MLYCKNCGKELKDDARFCDRCGQSVRRSQQSERSVKARQIEELQRERIKRQRLMKAQEQREERVNNLKQQKKQQKRSKKKKNLKKRGPFFAWTLIVLFVIIVSAVVSFIVTSRTSEDAIWKTKDASVELNATTVPTMQPSGDFIPATPMPTVSIARENKDVTDDDGYRVCELSTGIKCPYPSVFSKNETEDAQELNAVHTAGGGTLKIYAEEYPGGTPSSLMKAYAKKQGGTVEYSLAGSTWYAITVTKNGIVRHRKYVIDSSSDSVAYYDFEYDENSIFADDYKEYIDYMDDNFSVNRS